MCVCIYVYMNICMCVCVSMYVCMHDRKVKSKMDIMVAYYRVFYTTHKHSVVSL